MVAVLEQDVAAVDGQFLAYKVGAQKTRKEPVRLATPSKVFQGDEAQILIGFPAPVGFYGDLASVRAPRHSHSVNLVNLPRLEVGHTHNVDVPAASAPPSPASSSSPSFPFELPVSDMR